MPDACNAMLISRLFRRRRSRREDFTGSRFPLPMRMPDSLTRPRYRTIFLMSMISGLLVLPSFSFADSRATQVQAQFLAPASSDTQATALLKESR